MSRSAAATRRPRKAADLSLPKHPPYRLSAAAQAIYDAELAAWCEAIQELSSSLSFRVSSRGWCYVLEEHGLSKNDFDAAQKLINECRKSGLLPLDTYCDDERRSADGLECIDEDDVEDHAAGIINYIRTGHRYYTPVSFWENQDTYVEMAVEKVDLKSLFAPVCEPFHIPIRNVSGWSDINSRAAMTRRFAEWEAKGKRCILLHCGDHDPGGLHISDRLRSNLADLENAVGRSPEDLIIDRLGLDYDFIEAQGQTWIDNLATAKGAYPLDDPRHPDHMKSYVQDYLHRFCTRLPGGRWQGRKVEANALVVRADAGRELCRQAILRYIPETAVGEYQDQLADLREEVRLEILRQLEGGALSCRPKLLNKKPATGARWRA